MDARGGLTRGSRPSRSALFVLLGVVLAGATAAAAWPDARVGYSTTATQLAIGVDTRNGTDGDHPLSVAWLGSFESGWRVQVLAGHDASRLDAVAPCGAQGGATPTVVCRDARVELVRAVFGDGVDTLELQQPDSSGMYCLPGWRLPETRSPAEVRFGAGNDRLRVEEKVCAGDWRGSQEMGWVVRAFGQAGDDVLGGGLFNDLLDGGDGADRLTGSEGGDTLEGGAGSDRLSGEEGYDTLRGGDGDDQLDGGGGSDAILGEAGADTLRGGAGDDLVDGGNGADTLEGGDGDDTVRGGTGNDDLVSGPGRDTLDGGDGVLDSVSYAAETRPVVVTLADTAANDGIVVSGVSERDSVLRMESVSGGFVGDTLTGTDGLNVLSGEGGNDVLRGLGSRDLIRGGAGNDQLFGDDGNDDLRGEDGADQLTGGSGEDTLVGGPGNDGLKGEGGSDLLVGGAGSNLFLARDGEADRFDCALGSDRVDADLLDAVPAGCESVDRYALDDGKPGFASGTRVAADQAGSVAVAITCPATAVAACNGVVRLFNPSALDLALATSGTYTIGIGVSATVSISLPASVVTGLATLGSVVITTQEQGASASGPRDSRRTFAFARA